MDRPSADAPSAIGRYKIVERLATGATGDVYKGFDPVLQRPLAIKLLRIVFEAREPAAVDRIKERFYREIQRVAALVHPAIARLFDGGEAPGGFFMASEFIEGESLAEVIAARRSLETPARLALLRQISDALEYAREQHAPHLNLKSTNVLVCADKSVKVAGFGTARVYEAALDPRDWVTRFAPPEVVKGEAADARADVYSFAAIAVELLGGALVSPPDGRPARWMSEGSPPPLPAIASDRGAPTAAAVLARALSADVERRYPTAPACYEALGAALGLVSSRGPAVLWDTPPAAAGLTPDQLQQIEAAATQAGVPTFVKKTATDAEATSAGTVDGRRDASRPADTPTPPIKPPPPPPPPETVPPPAKAESAQPSPDASAETVLIPRRPAAPAPPPPAPAAPAPFAADPSEVKTTLMPATPRAPKFEPSDAHAAAPAEADAGKTVLIPRKKAVEPVPPSEVRTTLMPRVEKPADASEAKTTFMPPVPKAPAFEPAPSPQTKEATTKKQAVVPRPEPAAAKPAPPPYSSTPISFPPPPPAARTTTVPAAAAGAKRSSRAAGAVLVAIGVLALVTIAAVVAWFTVPGIRERVMGGERTARRPPITTAPATPTTTAPPAASAPPTTTSAEVPAVPPAEPATVAPAPVGAPAPPATAATTGSLRITSTPAGAAVTIDGRRRGVTPLRVSGIAFGDHAVALALDGYNTEQQRVTLSARRASQTINLRLTKTVAATTTGAISVTTEPAGARVMVDGAAAGTAPLTIANLAPGKHAVQAERDGYEPVMREVDVKAGDTVALALRLTAAAPARPAPPAAPTGPIPLEDVQTKPRQTRGPETPPYPRAAYEARLMGSVRIAWTVDETGAVTDVQVVESSSRLFEASVVAWARSLRYEPGRQGGRPVKVRFERKFSFERR